MLATRGRRSAATPVIVRKGALAETCRIADLRVTKGHSFFLDGVLIPVEFLVNHRSILWDDRAQEVSIYHIELETHDVLLANGAPAESYRDDGNRWLFQNANTGWDLAAQTAVRAGADRRRGGRCGVAAAAGPAGPRPGRAADGGSRICICWWTGCGWTRWRGARSYVFRLPRAPPAQRAGLAPRASAPRSSGWRAIPLLGVAVRRIVLEQGSQPRTIEAPELVPGGRLPRSSKLGLRNSLDGW